MSIPLPLQQLYPIFLAFLYLGGTQICLQPVIVHLWVQGWGGAGVFWWLASPIILLLKVWFAFTEIKGFCLLDYFFSVSNISESLNERRILMSFYTIRLPRAPCFVADVHVHFIFRDILPFQILFPFGFLYKTFLLYYFYVHVSHNYLGYTSFFPSVLSSYMYF